MTASAIHGVSTRASRALLRHPWRGDALYDRWETLVEAAVAEAGSPLESARGVDDYVAICALVASGLEQQVYFDLENLTRAIGRELSGSRARSLRGHAATGEPLDLARRRDVASGLSLDAGAARAGGARACRARQLRRYC